MHVVKSVGVMSVAKIMGLVYGCMGLLVVPLFLVAGFAGSFASHDKDVFPFAGIVGVVFAVLAPFIYAGMGFVMGAIGALIYNIVAKWVGGFELELTVWPPVSATSSPVVSPPAPVI
jgi:hypothetical protein